MNTELKKKQIIDFEKDFFKLINNSVFGKSSKLVTAEKRRNYLVSKLRYMDTDSFIVYIKTGKKTLQKMLKQDLTLQTMNQTDYY